MLPKQRQAKIAAAREHLRLANAELADFFQMDPTPAEVSWILQSTKLLEIIDLALIHAHSTAEGRQRAAP